MKRLRKKQCKRLVRQFLSLMLIASILVGLLPSSVYAQNTETSAMETEYSSEECCIIYKETSSWGNYVNADISITNNGETVKNTWEITFDYTGTIDNIWNADIVNCQDGQYYITAKDYNCVIEPGKTVSFGFTAHGDEAKPKVPEQIRFVGENCDDEPVVEESVEENSEETMSEESSGESETTQETDSAQESPSESETTQETDSTQESSSTEETTTEVQTEPQIKDEESSKESGSIFIDVEIPDEGPVYTIPEKWNGLNYALLSTGEENLSLYTAETSINGGIHTNKDFYYQGSILKIDGSLEASRSISIQTSTGSGTQVVTSKIESAPRVEMSDITRQICDYTEQNGIIYDGNKSFQSEKVVLDTPMGVNGDAVFNTTTFLGQGIVYADKAITYNVADLATPEDSRLFLMSKNGNITLNGSNININGVLYAPNGCVTINTANLNLNGRIIAKSVCINGSYININAGPSDYDMLEFLFRPEVELKVEGNLKENRKIVLSIEEILNTEYLIKEDTIWNVTKEGSDVSSCYAVNDENSDFFHKEMIFREAGTYNVSATVTTGDVFITVTKELVIAKDIEPVAGFIMSAESVKRNEDGNATISLTDCSASMDGDLIGERIWNIIYDENNDGLFEETPAYVTEGNETELTYVTNRVGKYKVVLNIKETFEDTIPKFLDEEAYKKDDTQDLEDAGCIFEVVNEAPVAKINLSKEKSADIVFTVGDVEKATLEAYNAKEEELKAILAEKGIDARVDTVSSSVLTAQDTFAWKEYDHYNYKDRYLPTMEKHILYNENDIQMMGYSYAALKDFLYIADENPGKKTFEFDLQRDGTDWHSMEGGGFLFNTTVDDEKNTIQGFCILVTQSGLKLIQIDCKNLNGFRNGSYSWVQYAGRLLKTYKISNLYDNHHIKIITDKNTISVWDGEKLLIDEYVLPQNDYGYGFGPIISHGSHGCSQQSYFTFKNITMETMKGSSLSDIVNGYDWRPGASHYVVHLSNEQIPEMASGEETAKLAASLITNDASFLGIGNENNEGQYLSLLNAIETGGMCLPSGDMEASMTETNAFIVDSVLAKDYTIGTYLTTDDIVAYEGYYQDAESDDIYEQQWEYEYDPSVFGSGIGELQHIVKSEVEPIKRFDNTGAYAIRLKVCDNPAGDNEALSEYRKWSGTDEYEKLVMVQSRPQAQVKVTVSKHATEADSCIANVTYTASDKDHPEDATAGIREEKFYYKNIKDGNWTEGKLPNKLTIGETYLVKYQVKDMEGTVSFPAVAVVTTSELLEYKEEEDKLAPEVFIDVAKEEIEVMEELRIDGYALDDMGVESFELYIDGEKYLETFGRVFYKGEKEKTVTVKAVATDIGGNRSEKEIKIKVVDNRDKIAPIAEITSPAAGTEVGFNIQIVGTADDEKEFSSYTLSYKEELEDTYTVFKESQTPVKKGELGVLDVSGFEEGTYEVLLTVTDVAGNSSYYGIGIHLTMDNVGEEELQDEVCPEAQITYLALSQDQSKIEIKGTVKDDRELDRYVLSYAQKNSTDFITLATGKEEIEDAELVTIVAETLQDGAYLLQLQAWDVTGNSTTYTQEFTYTKGKEVLDKKEGEGEDNPSTQEPRDEVYPEAQITYLALSQDQSRIEIKGTVKDDRELERYVLSYAKKGSTDFITLVTGDEEIEDADLTTIETETLQDGAYLLRLQAWDVTGNSRTYTQEFTYTKGQEVLDKKDGEGEDDPPTEEPVTPTDRKFAVTLSCGVANIGSKVQVQVTLPSNVKEETLEIKKGEDVLATGSKRAEFTSDKTGKITITATGMSDEGETVSAQAECTFYNMADKAYPTAQIISPAADESLTQPTDITGSAYDEEALDFWKLEYRLSGEKEYKLLNEGTEPVKEGVLGHLDTTVMRNGQYEVRLSVQDKGGNSRSITRTYIVEGKLKVGAMNIGFTDITANLSGSTVNVLRMYDSNNKMSGDFGYGWTLGMQGMEIYETSPITEGYELVQTGSIFSTAYYMRETQSHDVTISYGDGTSDRFELTFSPERKALVPITEVKLGYRCVTNPKVKLEVVQDTTAAVYSTQLLFYDESIYDTVSYKLTTQDGVEVYLNKEKGVYKIVDANGNVITVDKNGYHSEDGKSIELERDSEGRVTKATDPAGKVTTYTYDENGDLVAVTDSAERTVSFTYDKEHNLISITDPMGVAIARNEYDENGRLIAVIDAQGNRTEYTYDVEGRTQIVKDRRGNSTFYIYDDNGNILQTTDAYGNKKTNIYDDKNQLLSVTDENGNTTEYVYDESGNVTQITAADGTTVKSTYTQENLVSGIQMMGKVVMAVSYDDNGRITSIEDSNGNATEYSYTSDGRLSGLTDDIGTYQRITYDAEGNVASTTNGAGESASYAYDKDGRCTSITISREENGEVKTFTSYYSYNDAGDITQSIDHEGNVTSYEYDANGNQTASLDAKGRKIVYAYDDMGNMTGVTYPDGTTETFVYDANGNNISATDRNGLTVTMTYDKLNRMTEKKYADGSKESYVYDAVGNVIMTISASGATTVYTYDERNRNTAITDVYGNMTYFAYDEMARLTKRTDAKGNEITYKYDDNGNLVKTTYADGNSVTSKYDARNRMVSQVNQSGNRTTYEYDGADRLTKVTDAEGNSYTYGYDGNGNLVTVTDALEHVTRYSYDKAGRISQVKNALGKSMEYTYDETGNVTTYKDYAGNVTSYSYDTMDRIIKKTIGGETVSFTYGEKGQLEKVTDKSGNITYEYDTYGRLIKQTNAQNHTLQYTYDKTGRLSKFDNGFGTTSYEYDLLDRVTKVIDRNGKATLYEYDELGNRSVVRYPNGTAVSYTYDACQRLKEEWITDASGNTLAKYTYELGKAGERLSITELVVEKNGELVETEITYKYDNLERLVKETIVRGSNKLTNEYTYDAVNNRISKETTVKGELSELADVDREEVKLTEGKTTYSYSALNQLVVEETPNGTVTYTYDDNGNLINQSGATDTAYSYDKENHLVKATIQKGNSITIESYTYDYVGNRTSKTINETDTTYYVNDILSDLTMVVAQTDASGDETAYYTRGDELLSMERDGKCVYYLYDGHGSTRLLTDENGDITDHYAYDAYGNLLGKEGNTKNEFLYTGEQYNANTGLYYLRARYMNPATGSFISMDSYQGSSYDPVSLHKYLYANANPVMYTDPSGYLSISLGDTTTALAITGVLCTTVYLNIMNAIDLEPIAVYNANIRFNEALCTIIESGILFSEAVVVAEIAKAKVTAETMEKEEKKNRNYVVYTLIDKDGVVRYVGRTCDYGRRISEHKREGGKMALYNLKEGAVYRNLTKNQARGLEQTLIVLHHTLNNSRNPEVLFYNFVNGVGPNNKKAKDYYKASKEYINEYPTLFENFVDEEINAIKEDIGVWW